jgi:hypothetical protein
MFARKPTRKLADLEVILEDLFADTSPDPMVTLRFPEDGAVVQFLREDDTLDLYLNTSGTAGSIGEIRRAVEGLGVEVKRMDGIEGTEHVSFDGPTAVLASRAIPVVCAALGRSEGDEVEVFETSDRTALGSFLHTPLVGEDTRLSRRARRMLGGVLSFWAGLRLVVFLAGTLMVIGLAFGNPLIARILGTTAVAMVVVTLVYWIGRRRGSG